MNILEEFERGILSNLGWPLWAMRSIEALVGAVIIVFLIQFVIVQEEKKSEALAGGKYFWNSEFRIFQFQYLSVYLIIMLADWLQGTNMYTLYSSYEVNVGTLFITGFLSSALFGTFLGVYVDRWGRKFGCILFCVLEIVINLLEHIPSMPVLMFGRILGGLSTSLLFSAFESWYNTEHRKRKYPEELMASTFAISSWGNGVVAIAAGIFAQLASDVAGDIGPFQLAILLTAMTLILILFWTENYGKTEEGVDSIMQSIRSSTNKILKSPSMLYLGLSQSFFEGAVFTFVFMWVPSMQKVNSGQSLPTGLVFSCFMLCMTIGGMLFGILLPIFPGGAEGLCVFVYAVAACAMAVPIFKFEFWWVFCAFLVLETMVGMFNSCGATLRSQYYPEEMQSSIMTVFRLPLNLLVVVGTKLTDSANDIPSLQFVFGVVVSMHLIAMLLQILLSINSEKLKRQRAESVDYSCFSCFPDTKSKSD